MNNMMTHEHDVRDFWLQSSNNSGSDIRENRTRVSNAAYCFCTTSETMYVK